MIITARLIQRRNDTHPSPHISVVLQGQSFSGFVTFLIDTGADCTILQDKHVQILGIPPMALHPAPSGLTGVGGNSGASIVQNVDITFTTDTGSHTLNQDIWVMSPSQSAAALPAVLGRDIINQFKFTYDFNSRLAQLES